jgi:CRISPR-associated endonuclease Csn1
MKKILGLDLGTNSIGWSLIENDFEKKEGEIIGLGSRIIPMDQAQLSDFEKGNTISQTAQRTGYRGTRRLYQRDNLRRERLHRVLNVLGFLPGHYANNIDFETHFGQFKKGKEPKLNYRKNNSGKHEFIFIDSFKEMVKDFEANSQSIKIPYDWTIYYLRKKALTEKISKEELSWVILNFNQKRGYYQLRDEEEHDKTKLEELYSLKIKAVQETEDKNAKGTWYNVILENDWVYRRQSKEPIENWIGINKDFVVTTQLEKDGSPKLDKEGNVKRSFRSPKEDDWGLVKTKTQNNIDKFNEDNNTVGIANYIYKSLLQNPTQKIRGKFVKTIERKYYREELEAILETQIELHDDLLNRELYQASVNELYPRNEAHQNNIKDKDFKYLFVKDIIFYQRPLKSKKSTISNCQFETRYYIDKETKERKEVPLKGISKSHPMYQEFRLIQWIKNLKIYQKEKVVDGKTVFDTDVTHELLPDLKGKTALFDFLKTKKEVEQKHILKFFSDKELIPKQKKDAFTHRWNYVEDKRCPCYETRVSFVSRLNKIDGVNPDDFLTIETEQKLWHIVYSVKDKNEFKQALKTFAKKSNLDEADFVAAFEKYPPFNNNYGAFSEKAIKKLLPLMRFGVYWSQDDLGKDTLDRIDKILTGEVDKKIQIRVRELIQKDNREFSTVGDFNDLPLHLASYVVYNRHSETGDIKKWETPAAIDKYLEDFKQHSLRNPIVEQVVAETLRTVRDIWQYHGNGEEGFFDEIHVELGREMKNDKKVREKLSKQSLENENTNQRIRAVLQELINDGARPFSPSHQEILKIYEEGVYQSVDNVDDDIERIRKSSSPSKSDINKYKLWLEQRYISPYTGQPIPLSKLFTTAYQIEHIIPQSRYFDNSLSNKIICESEVNQLKDNQTAYEFIKSPRMKIVDLGQGKNVEIYSLEQYESHCNRYFKKNRIKHKKLMSEDIPKGFIERQLNDSRYISKLIKGLLSNIVRDENEQEATSKNIVPLTGAITAKLRQDWGLNDKWNELVAPRFKRLNELTDTNDFGYWDDQINAFRTQVPDKLSKGFSKKRIDHRHHALDALVIACCTKKHTNYLGSINAENKNYSLRDSLLIKNKEGNYTKHFQIPWGRFATEAKERLEKTIISFKQNTRVINKTSNKTWQWVEDHGQLKKKLVPQTRGANWAIRKPMHKETVSGKLKWEAPKGKIFTATRDPIFIIKSRKILDKITDTGIKKILNSHVKNYTDEKGKENFELAFNQEGIYELNKNIKELNNGKNHQPIYRARFYEVGSKSNLSENEKSTKSAKYVEAAKGTNLFFAIYWDEEKQKRMYDTIPLNEVIEHQKQVAHLPKKERTEIPTNSEKGQFLFSLSPNDLVYVPTDDEIDQPNLVDFDNLSKEQTERVYKMVSSTGSECHFISSRVSHLIKSYDAQSKLGEFGSLNKSEKSINRETIKERCWKLVVDRLGNLSGNKL